jgi:hypothetical protein
MKKPLPTSNLIGKETIPETVQVVDTVRCSVCGHKFGAAELAAVRTVNEEPDGCRVTCSSCGAHNQLVAQPSPGLDHQPEVIVTNPEGPDAQNH